MSEKRERIFDPSDFSLVGLVADAMLGLDIFYRGGNNPYLSKVDQIADLLEKTDSQGRFNSRNMGETVLMNAIAGDRKDYWKGKKITDLTREVTHMSEELRSYRNWNETKRKEMSDFLFGLFDEVVKYHTPRSGYYGLISAA